MDFAESPEHEMLRAAVRDVAATFGHEYYAEKVRTGERATELWDAIGELGFLGVHLPEEYGGGGAGMVELAIVCEELAAQGCPLLLILVSPAICGELIATFGTVAQKDRWLRPMAEGAKMVFAITEPDAGSNSHNIATTATRDGDVYRLNGSKTYISGVDEADSMVVVTRTSTDPDSGRARLSLFVVDTDAPGLERTLIPMEISGPEKQFTLFFDDVEVPVDRLLGDVGEGLRQVFVGLNPERIMSAAICTGIGRYALEKAAAYANEREVWGTPIGRHQGIAHPLATAKIEVELARLMTLKAAWLHDQTHTKPPARTDTGPTPEPQRSGGEQLGSVPTRRVSTDTERTSNKDGGEQFRSVPTNTFRTHTERRNNEAAEAANMAKYAAAEAGLHALDAAIQTHGGNGLSSEYGLADLWGMVRLLRIAPVSREMVLNFVAQQSLGLPKSY
ncbi:MAG: acyl-CoA dehydrogenase family protein [Acidimicrobiia bacterium]